MQRGTLRAFYELLSSMRFAISLLTVLAIASIIGTVLKQNEPYNAYLNQFGPFWFPVFEKLGLYSVYGAPWFLVILAFLVLSTTVCILRQTRPMLREMRGFKEHAREASLRNFSHQTSFRTSALSDIRGRVLAYLAEQGFKAHTNERANGVLIAAKQGVAGRLGYFLAHGAIVLICFGGLLDGNLPLKLQMALGGKEISSGNQLITDIPVKSRLGVENWSFRGNVFIPEGRSSSVAVLNIKDGILLQDLPFTVSLRKFHIDHYPNGMPKRFASDIVLTDTASGESFEKTIEVNKPFEYDGLTLYQASFEDGGSKLTLEARSLQPGISDQQVAGAVGDSLQVTVGQSPFTLELTGFRPFNVENFAATGVAEESTLSQVEKHLGSGAKGASTKDLRNVGPSFQYKLRDSAGQAREYTSYMAPVEQDGRRFMLSGMRESQADAFRYMRIPVDEDDRIDTWFVVRKLMLDPATQAELGRRFARRALAGDKQTPAVQQRLEETASKTLQLFAQKGYETVGRFIESSVPEAEREKAADVFVKILQGATWEAWMMAREKAGLSPLTPSDRYALYVGDALSAVSDSLHYGAPLYFQLTGFDQVQASVLQVTRSPGKPLVFLGSLLLVVGIVAMLYIRERRLFVLIKDTGEMLIAMSSNRRALDVDQAFARHVAGIKSAVSIADDTVENTR